MRNLIDECAMMAATMLDAELVTIARKSSSAPRKTPLQEAVQHEIRKRGILD